MEVLQNFKNLLLTSPGERMMNLDFGRQSVHHNRLVDIILKLSEGAQIPTRPILI